MKFRDMYYFLSNMYPTKVPMNIGGKDYVFDNAEAAFQAQKNPEWASKFVGLDGFGARRLGRQVPIDRSVWADARLGAMRNAVSSKFNNNPDLMKQLQGLADQYIAEDNTWGDTFWGVDANTGKGSNNLGKMLMDIRDGRLTNPQSLEQIADQTMGSVRTIPGNIMNSPDPYIMQQVNTLGVMGAGLAKQIRSDLSPESYAKYVNLSKQQGASLLGKTLPLHSVSNPNRTYLNIFGQSEIGHNPNKVYTDYDALEQAFTNIANKYPEGTAISMPVGMGAGLANGDWDTIEGLADRILGSKMNLTKYKFNGDSIRKIASVAAPIAQTVAAVTPNKADDVVANAATALKIADIINHPKFGVGRVTRIKDGLVDVNFTNAGTKHLNLDWLAKNLLK